MTKKAAKNLKIEVKTQKRAEKVVMKQTIKDLKEEKESVKVNHQLTVGLICGK